MDNFLSFSSKIVEMLYLWNEMQLVEIHTIHMKYKKGYKICSEPKIHYDSNLKVRVRLNFQSTAGRSQLSIKRNIMSEHHITKYATINEKYVCLFIQKSAMYCFDVLRRDGKLIEFGNFDFREGDESHS